MSEMLLHMLSTIFVPIVIGGVLAALGYWLRLLWTAETRQDDTFRFRAEDGWPLALHRYRPRHGHEGLPVILCHGLSGNRRAFDLRGAPSLALFLRELGWDVWVAELRGAGSSGKPGPIRSDVPYDWDFEDHLRKDLPAIIGYVMERTGAQAVHWVGHSMGGMLIQAYLAHTPRPPVASAVTLASPIGFQAPHLSLFRRLSRGRWMLFPKPYLPIPVMNRLMAPFIYRLQNRFTGLFNPRNIREETALRFVCSATEIMGSPALWSDFDRWLASEKFCRKDGEEYVTAVPSAPVLVMGCSADGLAPEASTKPPYETSHQPSLQHHLILGKTAGCAEDYGHIDILVGERVEMEVFPHIAQWLSAHDRGLSRSGRCAESARQ